MLYMLIPSTIRRFSPKILLLRDLIFWTFDAFWYALKQILTNFVRHLPRSPPYLVRKTLIWAQSDTLIRSLRVGTFLLLLQNIWFEKESRNRPMPCLNFINARSTFWTRQTKYSNYQYLPVLRTDNRFSCTTDSFYSQNVFEKVF